MKPSNIGGQAVMEGIMMRHKDKYSIAVRRPDKEIEVKVEDYKCIFGKARIWRKPIIRGMVSFIDSLVTGTKCLMYSAEIAGDEEDEEETRKNAALSPEELEAKLKEIIARVGATSGKDMGKVMGVASKELAGLAEGRAISAKVKELLG